MRAPHRTGGARWGAVSVESALSLAPTRPRHSGIGSACGSRPRLQVRTSPPRPEGLPSSVSRGRAEHGESARTTEHNAKAVTATPDPWVTRHARARTLEIGWAQVPRRDGRAPPPDKGPGA